MESLFLSHFLYVPWLQFMPGAKPRSLQTHMNGFAGEGVMFAPQHCKTWSGGSQVQGEIISISAPHVSQCNRWPEGWATGVPPNGNFSVGVMSRLLSKVIRCQRKGTFYANCGPIRVYRLRSSAKKSTVSRVTGSRYPTAE